MQTNTMTEVQVLGFVKEEGIWYADLPQFLEQGLGTKPSIAGKDCILLMLSYLGEANVKQVKQTIEKFYGIQTTIVKATMPEFASAHDRGRYNANKILAYLQQQYPNKQVIALTSKDICTNLNGKPCWGVLGLSNLGKTYSVSSVSRIKSDKENLLSKVAIHEVGHGLDLPHCKS